MSSIEMNDQIYNWCYIATIWSIHPNVVESFIVCFWVQSIELWCISNLSADGTSQTGKRWSCQIDVLNKLVEDDAVRRQRPIVSHTPPQLFYSIQLIVIKRSTKVGSYFILIQDNTLLILGQFNHHHHQYTRFVIKMIPKVRNVVSMSNLSKIKIF